MEKYSQWRDKGTGIQTFLPYRVKIPKKKYSSIIIIVEK